MAARPGAAAQPRKELTRRRSGGSGAGRERAGTTGAAGAGRGHPEGGPRWPSGAGPRPAAPAGLAQTMAAGQCPPAARRRPPAAAPAAAGLLYLAARGLPLAEADERAAGPAPWGNRDPGRPRLRQVPRRGAERGILKRVGRGVFIYHVPTMCREPSVCPGPQSRFC